MDLCDIDLHIKARNATDHNCVGITHLQMLWTREHAARTRGPASGSAAGGAGADTLLICVGMLNTQLLFLLFQILFSHVTLLTTVTTRRSFILTLGGGAEAGSCEAARGGFWWMMDGEEEGDICILQHR